MSDTLIKNIQIGDETYQIAGSQNNSSLTRGKTIPISIGESTGVALLARPNEISSLIIQNSDEAGLVVALPHEMLQESGELWNILGEIPIIVSHNSTDVPGCPHKATLCMFSPEDVGSSSSLSYILDSMDGILGSLLNVNTLGLKICIYCSENFIEATPESTFIVRACLMDGSVLMEETIPSENLLELLTTYPPTTGDTMIVGFMLSEIGVGPVAIACNIVEKPGALFKYSITLNVGDESVNLYAKSLEPGSMSYYEESEETPVGCILYTGSSYMDVNPVSHYMFNINISPETMFITNIPTAWTNNTPPTFSQDKLVQISVLDGIGAFNEVTQL